MKFPKGGLVTGAITLLIGACGDSATDTPTTDIDSGTDAGVTTDSGVHVDTGIVSDTGVKIDTGVDAGTCATAGCSTDATCVAGDGGGPICTCKPGFSGNGKSCTNIDDCAGNPCMNGGTCADGVNSYTCTCAAGYSGTTCATNIDDCAGNPCMNGGACADGVNSYTCTCAPGYSGTTCATNINECAGNPCINGGTCTDGITAFTCACAPGYSGATCATNIDECAGNPCMNGGICTDGINAFTCACAPGYSGTTCGTNIDDCAGNPCLNGGSCADGINAFTCTCAGGYSGATCTVPPVPKSCSEIKAANAASADGVYTIDPDGVGGNASISAYCDMTTDGGGWTKILQYHTASYTPTAQASGDVTTAATPAFAKLSDAAINSIGASIGSGRVYRIKGPTSPTGMKLFIFSTGTFTDTAVGMGLNGTGIKVCETATFSSCATTTFTTTYIDSLVWGLVGNDSNRYFADYAGGSGVNCYNPSAAGVRCFNAGVSTGHALIPDISIWIK